jgi:hypothetical protein
MLPKIFLMDYAHEQKCERGVLTINLLHEKSHFNNARSLQKMINSKYQNKIGSYTIEVNLIAYEDMQNSSGNIFYMFPSSEKNIKDAIFVAKRNSAITFAYLEDNLRYGAMISINVGVQVKPILNLEAIRANEITFRPLLLDISLIFSSINRHNNTLIKDLSDMILIAMGDFGQ